MSRGTVILVPGFLGSELIGRNVFGGDLTYWLSTHAMIATGFEACALPLPDRPGIPPEGFGVRPGYPLEGPYRDAIQYLQLRDWEVRAPVLDWRLPVQELATVLFDLIHERPEEWPVHLLCHSRGGLIARVAIGRISLDDRPNVIGRVIGCGVPHTGSLNTVATFGNASDFVRNLRNVTRLLNPFQTLFVSGNRINNCLRSWPSLYELLPDPKRSDLSPAGVTAVYSGLSYADDGIGPWSPYLVAAKAGWDAVPDVPPSVQWVDVVGYGTETLAGLAVPYDLTHRRGYFLGEGDGAVVAQVAGKYGRVRIEVPARHDAMLRDGRLLPLIHSALLAYPAFDVRISGAVSS